MSFTHFFKRLLGKKTHPAHLPYIPTPPSPQQGTSYPNQFPDNSATPETFTETDADINTISGTRIGFGTQNFIQVEGPHAKTLSQTQSHIIGTGKLVSKIDDIAGVCQYCQAEAMQAFEANLINSEQVQVKSLYDTLSASRCDICGTSTCCRHCRPIQMPDGLIQQLCVECQRQLKGQILKHTIVRFLLSPFLETNETPKYKEG